MLTFFALSMNSFGFLMDSPILNIDNKQENKNFGKINLIKNSSFSEIVADIMQSVNKETKKIEYTSLVMGKDAPSRARKLVKTDDVIFATVRPTHSRVAVITEEYNEQVCSTGYFVLRTKEAN